MVAKDGITQTEAVSQAFTDVFFLEGKRGPGRCVTIM